MCLSIRKRVRTSWRSPTSTTIAANVAILAGNGCTGILSARALGPAGRGQLALVMLWSAVMTIAGSCGLQSSCAYYAARWPDRRAAILLWCGRVAALQTVAMTAVSAALMWWLHLRFAVGPILAWEYSTWPAVATITLYGVCYAQGIRNFARFNLLRISQGIIAGALMLVGVLAGRLTPAEAGAAYLIPAWSTAVAVVIWLRRASPAAANKPLTPYERHTMWSYGWRSLASLTSLALNRNADQLALGFLVSAGSLGIYNVAESASGPLLDIVKSFGMVGLPAVAALSGGTKSSVTWQTLRRAFFLVALIAPLFAFSFPWAIRTVYGDGYSSAVMTAELLLAGTAFASLASVADDLLRAHGRPGSVSLTEGIGGMVTILGVVALKGHSLDAVALVSLLGYVAAFSLAFIRLSLAARGPRAAPEQPRSLVIVRSGD